MSTATRIDELRKKFEEHPRRYFAPLANEYRKTGELSQAIALCREHLPKQPGHMSGYIVFGQALFESGAADEARAVFEQALALDPENLIALRHLGDIAKMTGDASAARRWYERVLDADPRNDDIAAQLATLVVVPTPRFSAALTPTFGMSALGLTAIPTPDASMRAVDFDRVNARIAHQSPLDLEAIADTERDTDAAFNFPIAAELDDAPADDVDAGAPVSDFEEGLIAPEWPDTSDLVARVVTARNLTPVDVPITFDEAAAFGREAGDPPSPHYEQRVEAALVNEITDANNETEKPSHLTWLVTPASTEALQWITAHDQAVVADEQREDTDRGDAVAEDAGGVGNYDVVTMPTVSNTPPLGVETSFADVMDEEDLHDAIATDSPAFVTQTMAELLVAQGFVARAAEIYEELIRRHSDDASLHSRLVELRVSLDAAVATSVPTPLYSTPVEGTRASNTPAWIPVETPVVTRLTARHTFARLAARRVPRRTPLQPVLAIEDPADGLSALFGFAAAPKDDAAARSLADAFAPISAANMADGATLDLSSASSTPLSTPAVAAATPTYGGAAVSAAPETPHDAFSFDRFFPDPAATSSISTPAVPMAPPAGDDLAEFSAWLKGLGTR